MSLTFSEKLRSVRAKKKDLFGKPLSQEKASRLFGVSMSTYRNWEADPPRALPDNRSRESLQTIWPELFLN
jgi:DNA-binding transcriptional regulator YiaG